MQLPGQRHLAEIDDGTAKDVPVAIDSETCAAVLKEETQAMLALVVIDAALADRGDRLGPHQFRDFLRRDVQQASDKRRIDDDIFFGEGNPHGQIHNSHEIGRGLKRGAEPALLISPAIFSERSVPSFCPPA
jgi:hypothetical protein